MLPTNRGHDIYWDRQLGKGNYGTIYHTSNPEVVYKGWRKIPSDRCFGPDEVGELSIMNSMARKNIPYVQRAEGQIYEDEHGYFMVRKERTLGEKVDWTETQIRRAMFQLMVALYYLHENNVIYVDMKPNNILLDVDDNITLTDFGISQFHNYTTTDNNRSRPTAPYSAPEILLDDENYKPSIDIWGAGMIFYYLLTGKTLLSGGAYWERYRQFCKIFGTPNERTWEGVTVLPKFYELNRSINFEEYDKNFPWTNNAIVNDLLGGMLTPDPGRRFTAYQCLNHRYFDPVRQEILIKVVDTQYDIEALLESIDNMDSNNGNMPSRRISAEEWTTGILHCKNILNDISGSDKTALFLALRCFAPLYDKHPELEFHYALNLAMYLAYALLDPNKTSFRTYNLSKHDCALVYEMFEMMNYNVYLPTPVLYVNTISSFFKELYVDVSRNVVIDMLYEALDYPQYIHYPMKVLVVAAIRLTHTNESMKILSEVTGYGGEVVISAMDFLSDIRKNKVLNSTS